MGDDGSSPGVDWKTDSLTPVNHVPGELCLVIEDPAFRWRRYQANSDPQGALDRYGQAVYAAVLTHMNRVVRDVRLPVSVDAPSDKLGAASVDLMGRSPLERDLTPGVGFRAYFGLSTLNTAVFRPLPSRRSTPRPWVLLPRLRGMVVLAFFAVGPTELTIDEGDRGAQRRDWRSRSLPLHQQRIRELVKLLNWRALPQADVPALGGLTVRAATPNWLTCPTHSHGSPGTLPVRLTPVEVQALGDGGRGKFTFRFVDDGLLRRAGDPAGAAARLLAQQQLDTLVERMRLPVARGVDPRVVVAVLDTAPSPEAIVTRAAVAADNALLADIAGEVGRPDGHVVIDGAGLAEPFDHVAGFRSNLRDRLASNGAASLVDHGLFVAGIVRDIAPRATVRLIRVLDDSGVGDVATLFQVLQQLPGQLERGSRLIINLSLVADLPTADELLAQWFPQTHADATALRYSWQMIGAMLGLTHRCLQETLDWLAAQDVLVVAAAGNEGFDPAMRPEPLYPAAYDTVLSVAAVTRSDEPAQFSNRGDMRVFGNGVAVFGGQGLAPSDEALPDVPKAGKDGWRDAVAGIFSAATIPLAPAVAATNDTGWVWWSGTSFAAPIVAAIAANLLLDAPTRRLSAAELMQTIRGYATIPEFALERDGPFDCSAIFARQVWRSTPAESVTTPR
ncbi:MAG: S8 family serine peptidase [Chloroflexi bacterium]|nr:S8 family serine peptidase [Chloroflexota bacterium]